MQDIETELPFDVLFEDMPPPGVKRVAVIIGRFNPPTAGHYLVIDQVKRFIRQNKNLNLESTPIVVVIGGGSTDADKKRNPLSVNDRILFMKSSGRADGVIFRSAKNAYAAFEELRADGLEPIAFAAGSDRADQYLKMLDKYFLDVNGNPIKHYPIILNRDSDAIETSTDKKQKSLDNTLAKLHSNEDLDVGSISGSLARRAVELGYELEFAKIVGLEAKPELAKKMFNKIATAIKE